MGSNSTNDIKPKPKENVQKYKKIENKKMNIKEEIESN